eukprot:scaffold123426_cov31-Tisochrysis_lutea.AAC.7
MPMQRFIHLHRPMSPRSPHRRDRCSTAASDPPMGACPRLPRDDCARSPATRAPLRRTRASRTMASSM